MAQLGASLPAFKHPLAHGPTSYGRGRLLRLTFRECPRYAELLPAASEVRIEVKAAAANPTEFSNDAK
jgi:hypothetical protein